jgi:glutathione synthase/RimK-type ligase-like ATP-grasp enzyme
VKSEAPAPGATTLRERFLLHSRVHGPGSTAGEVVLITDHSSMEGSRHTLTAAVERLTGKRPICIDARHFMTGDTGWVARTDEDIVIGVTAEDLVVKPATVLVYEIPPASRRRFAEFQHKLQQYGIAALSSDAEAWRNATEKDRTVSCFLRAGIPHAETIVLRRPTLVSALNAYKRLGPDVWTRPTVGVAGGDVFHITTREQLHSALLFYTERGQSWLMSRDARNITERGERQSFRIVVLHDRPLWACEHIQPNPDRPTNEAAGAASTRISLDQVPDELLHAAIAATRSVGLRFGGVDLALTGTPVFEVNVHPVLLGDRHLEAVALPWVQAQLVKTPL